MLKTKVDQVNRYLIDVAQSPNIIKTTPG